MKRYTEHERMKAVKGESQVIGSFLEWLQDKGIELHLFKDDDCAPVRKSIEQILAEYFEISLKKVEKEKRKMIEDFRKANKLS